MIPSVLRGRVWQYNFGNRRMSPGGLAWHILSSLYPENKKSIDAIQTSSEYISRVSRYSLKVSVQRLKEKGLVVGEKAGKGRSRQYMLTDLGRWIAISHNLDLSFLELCVLACACCVQTRYARSGKLGFYMRSYFERILGEYYSKEYVQKTFSSLNCKGFASRYVKKTMRVYPQVLEILMGQYGIYFEGLESWLYDLKENELEIFSKALDGFSWEQAASKTIC